MSAQPEAWRAEVKALNTALAQAQAEFPPIPRDRKVTVQKKAGGSFTYSYAPLDSILKAVRPALAAHGLALVQILEDDGRGPALRTELRHQEGGVIAGTFPLPRAPEDAQGLGSLLTYLRRYAITAILGIATEEDDDGAGAKGGKPPPPKPEPEATAFTPPALKPDPELAPLVETVQLQLANLPKLAAQVDEPPRDWLAWVREEIGLHDDEIGNADHYRRATELLGREETRLVAELARTTAGG